MKIGVDVDGVLFDTENFFRVESLIFDVENGGKGEVNKEECYFQYRFDWTEQEEIDFLAKCYEEVELNAPIMPSAKYVLNKLKEMGHELYIITNRGSYFENEVEITEKRLKEEGIDIFDGYYYYSKNKGEVCKNLKIDVMIDDLYENVEKVTNVGIKCLYYRDLVLKFFNHELSHEVRNWADIYYEIVNFDKWNKK